MDTTAPVVYGSYTLELYITAIYHDHSVIEGRQWFSYYLQQVVPLIFKVVIAQVIVNAR